MKEAQRLRGVPARRRESPAARAGSAARAVVAGLLALLFAGCAAGPRPVPPEAPAASTPAPGTATPPLPAPAQLPASPAARLLREAAAACAAGDVATGLARLDRALRIEPRDAALYLEMARCHRSGGEARRAAADAERGLSYCDGELCRELRRFLDR